MENEVFIKEITSVKRKLILQNFQPSFNKFQKNCTFPIPKAKQINI